MNKEIERLASTLGSLLKKTGVKAVTAESCTGGGVAEAITSVAGSSAWFDGGVVSYSNHAKEKMLGVKSETLARFGAVSEEVVLEMAQGVVRESDAHISVAVSGIAGPDGGTVEKPVGTIWFAWGQKLGYAEAEKVCFCGDRQQVREQAVIFALEGMIQRLSND